MGHLPKPPKKSIIYQDKKLYVCLALYPLTKGHMIVAWKHGIKDIHALSCEDYDYLMNIVDVSRDALLKVLNVEKVYMLYMDEVKDVHWHLIPRYSEKGFNVFSHDPKRTDDFSLANKIKPAFLKIKKKHSELIG